MTFHVITGGGAAAQRTALLLAEDGERVRIVTRSGSGPDHPLVEKVAADAADADQLTPLVEGAETLFATAAPRYDRWPEQFPALASGMLTAVRRTGVPYVMLGNLYGYGLVDGPVRPDLPMRATGRKGTVRARIWEEALASGVHVTEVRAAQFYGAGAVSLFSLTVQPKVLAGTLALVPQELDVPHSFSSIVDTARTLVAARREPGSWGRAWHVPVVTPTVRELAGRLAFLAKAPEPRLDQLTERDLALLTFTDPFWAELSEVLVTPGTPYISDFTETEKILGITPTPADLVLAELL